MPDAELRRGASSNERPILAIDLAGAVAQAGVDPTSESRTLQYALRRAIATRRHGLARP